MGLFENIDDPQFDLACQLKNENMPKQHPDLRNINLNEIKSSCAIIKVANENELPISKVSSHISSGKKVKKPRKNRSWVFIVKLALTFLTGFLISQTIDSILFKYDLTPESYLSTAGRFGFIMACVLFIFYHLWILYAVWNSYWFPLVWYLLAYVAFYMIMFLLPIIYYSQLDARETSTSRGIVQDRLITISLLLNTGVEMVFMSLFAYYITKKNNRRGPLGVANSSQLIV